jgi:phosphotransferase system  glucose/maltose/N-acetylglucosamine-specific IIC component
MAVFRAVGLLCVIVAIIAHLLFIFGLLPLQLGLGIFGTSGEKAKLKSKSLNE